jgi:hypothetical protein
MSVQNFETTKVPILKLPLENPKKKSHLNVIFIKKHKIYYKENNDAPSQRLQDV